ncbi:cilia- and flagella-associated protein 251-like [Aotus nancymaae]|uniref:cilia- and flagella-associated protein 251-like n=1 Tax=Aotus nancymaae TaxID=37293 RepID=UPI0030FF1433
MRSLEKVLDKDEGKDEDEEKGEEEEKKEKEEEKEENKKSRNKQPSPSKLTLQINNQTFRLCSHSKLEMEEVHERDLYKKRHIDKKNAYIYIQYKFYMTREPS